MNDKMKAKKCYCKSNFKFYGCMTQTKYYLKEKCTCDCHKLEIPHLSASICCRNFNGFHRGADVTKLMEAIQKKFNYSYEDDFIKPFEDLIEVEE